MKYYCLTPATKDKPGVCVLPPLHESVNPSDFDHIDKKVLMENFAPLEKFPTSCDRVGWFSGESIVEIFVNGKWQPTGGRTGVIPEEYRREFIVPQSEEKGF
jgi:hypothetical protein